MIEADAGEEVAAFLPAEDRAVIAGIRGLKPPIGDLSWDRVARLAAAHGVEALLHCAWSAMPEAIPANLLEGLGEARRRNALRGALGLCQRDEILQILEREGIPCLVLKGAALARVWYGDLSLRPFLDIDVLVPPGEIDRARTLLLRAGYLQQDVPWMAPHHDTPLYRADLPCAVELHRGVSDLPLRRTPSFEELYARSITLPGRESHVRTLGPEDALLHLCLHQIAHLKRAAGWRLRHIWDIARHVAAFPIDWELFGERADELALRQACACILGLTVLVTGADVPEEQIDRQAALQLFQRPAPARIDEHLVAGFMAALAGRDARRALAILARKMVPADKAERWRIRDLRPHYLLGPAWRLARKSVAEGGALQAQVRDWNTEQLHQRQTDNLVAALLAPGAPDHTRIAS